MLQVVKSCRYSRIYDEFINANTLIYSDYQNNFFKTECVSIFASDLNKSIVILAQNDINDRVLIIWNAETDQQSNSEFFNHPSSFI